LLPDLRHLPGTPAAPPLFQKQQSNEPRQKRLFVAIGQILIIWNMELKKTKQADLQSKSFLFFNIGLVVSLSLMIAAFNYKVYDSDGKLELVQTASVMDETIEVPVTEQLPPPPPELTQPQVIEVPNEETIEEDIRINMDIETHIDQKIVEATPLPQADIVVEKEDPHEIFIVVEETAAPTGGMPAFYQFVLKNMKYPAPAKRMDIEGKVFVQFIVEKDGRITDVQTVKGIGGGCDEEAVRVVQLSPNWKPAKQRGRAVRQRMILPITFILSRK
jgi:periplasmic protein TonB